MAAALPRPKGTARKAAPKKKPSPATRFNPLQAFREHIKARAVSEQFAGVRDRYKGTLMDWLATNGEEVDDTGSRFYYFDEPEPNPCVKKDGTPMPDVVAIKREKRGGQPVLNAEKVAELAKKKKLDIALFQEVIPEQRVISEDLVLAAAFAKTITDAEMRACYDEGEPTYAFVLVN